MFEISHTNIYYGEKMNTSESTISLTPPGYLQAHLPPHIIANSRSQFADAPTISIIDGTMPSSNLDSIFSLRYQAYCIECGFLPAEDYPNKMETDCYDSNSVHFTAIDGYSELIGTVRLILGKENTPFPLENNCQFNEDFNVPHFSKVGEISRLILNSSLRRRHNDNLQGCGSRETSDEAAVTFVRKYNSNQILLFSMYRAIVQYCLLNKITDLYAAMERSLARSLQRTGFVFRPIGPESEYYGRVTPYILNIRQLKSDIAFRDPELSKWVFKD